MTTITRERLIESVRLPLSVTLHDGSQVRLSKVNKGYDPTDRAGAYAYIQRQLAERESALDARTAAA